KDPKDADAILGKARVYNYSDRLDQAERLYRQVISLEPENYNAHVELADVLARGGNWPEAVATYRLAIERNPTDLKTQVELARALRYSRRYDEAIPVLDKVIEMDPRYAAAYTERGLVLGYQQRYEPAIADLHKALEIAPTDRMAQLGLAEVLGYARRYDESITRYREVLEHDPENEKARTELGLVLTYAGRYDEALGELNKVLAQNPDNVSAQIGKADALARSNRLPDAITLYQTILQKQPRNQRAQLGLADAYVYNRQYDDALRIYDTLIVAEPDNTGYKIGRAKTLGYAGRYTESVTALRPIVQDNPNNVEARLALAEALTNSGNDAYWPEAVTQYRTVLQTDATNVAARTGLGRVYSYMGRTGEAESQLRRVVQESPNNEEALLALAETLRYRKPFEARKYYSRVSAMSPANRQAQQGLSFVRRATAPYLRVQGSYHEDTNDVRIRDFEIGPIVPTPLGTVGLTYSTGRFSDIDDLFGTRMTLRRRALNLLLARNFGDLQARLVASRVRYNGAAPNRNLYDAFFQMSPRQRKRYYAGVAKREILESLVAVQLGITARRYVAGLEHPVGSHFDFQLEGEHLDYSDDNKRNRVTTALLYRLRRKSPTLRVGLNYVFDDTEFTTDPFIYYTPQDFHSVGLVADYVVTRDRLRYGIFGALPFTNRTGTNNENRPAKTLYGFAEYDLSDLLTLYANGGFVRSPTYDANEITGGVNIRF
ncbi:MAG: tetratricopeptide repeat protein, partial [Armatimonadota bacterium]|nr:tetratricopeptide repeat protein [Armatimonadota bacterium]